MKVTDTCQIQVADIYRMSSELICPESLCVIYEENAMVKYPGRVYTDFGQACLIISMSCMIHGSCIDMCATHCTQMSDSSICIHTVDLNVAVFEVISL